MKNKFSYWAQALDNSSPDHIILEGEGTLPEDQIKRQQVVKLVSAVIKRGVRIFDAGGLKLTVNSPNFVVELPSEQRDVVGRIAPLICYGQIDYLEVEHSGNEVFEGLSGFARSIERTISLEYSEFISSAFERLKKKSSDKRKRLVALALVIVIILVVAVSAWVKTQVRP